MKVQRWFASIAVLGLAVALAGCSSSSKTTPSSATSATSTTSSLTSAATTTAGLYNSLGGSTGVNALAESFGAKLAINPSVTKFLDAAAIDAVQGGFVNSLSALAGQSTPAGSTDLLGALSGKGLDANAVNGVTESLMSAGKERSLKPEQMAGLEALMKPVSASLLKGM